MLFTYLSRNFLQNKFIYPTCLFGLSNLFTNNQKDDINYSPVVGAAVVTSAVVGGSVEVGGVSVASELVLKKIIVLLQLKKNSIQSKVLIVSMYFLLR